MSNPSRVALVTGASSGIGKAIALRLLQEGWTVYGAARRTNRMADIQAAGAAILPMDLTDEESMAAALRQLVSAEGRLDALVNNAGYGSYGALEDVGLDEARRQFEVNVFGLMRLTQLALPGMRAAGRGTIVNISSMGGRIWMPMGGWYHATKHALEVLSDVLRMELKPFGLKVVVIQPGAIESEWSSIAADNLARTSRGSAYHELSGLMGSTLENYSQAAPPERVAAAVSKALKARNPRRRYAVPGDARLLIALKRLLPDALWEQMIGLGLRFRSRRNKTR